MIIEFSKEDIEQIKRICRSEIQRFWYHANEELSKFTDKDLFEMSK